jgi:hypothetical protein
MSRTLILLPNSRKLFWKVSEKYSLNDVILRYSNIRFWIVGAEITIPEDVNITPSVVRGICRSLCNSALSLP